MPGKIIIAGAGPTGIGAAHRLKESGYNNWIIHERHDYVGGLSASFKDSEGFTWDVGGHVLFSHYEKFDRMVDEALGSNYLEHLRESWINIFKSWVPYPFQNNLRYLPREILHECLTGLFRANLNSHRKADNFAQWALYTFGQGIYKYFMLPYNKKVWATDLEKMSKDWISERVSVIDFERVLKNVILERDDVSWGPNNKFRFPLNGGTGEIFRQIASRFKDHLHYNKDINWIDTESKKIGCCDGSSETYDVLISTIPLDQLIKRIKNKPDRIVKLAQKLTANSGLIIGIGFSRPDPSKKCWMYFPENRSPCYRVTYFSNYSPRNVPEINNNFSLMGEISYPKETQLPANKAIEKTLEGFIKTGLIAESDRDRVKSVYTIDIDYSYPVPTLDRDNALNTLHPWLESHNIYSRGRFGSWKYEIGNMDHSVMQGVEIVDRILKDKKETVISL